ncbi:hypothetical protein [Nesterenkonia rhizosphaerae]|uniref:Uncharacterized protein n=1 Tax=Nesterenkonia rhizosphaerae TaxID=1348272 RepID=A0ABP9G064_9MICC
MTHPYFTERARDVIARAGGNPDNAEALATWAEQAKAEGKDRNAGVLVSQDGALVAETFQTQDEIRASYVTADEARQYSLQGNEVGLAIGQIQRQIGQRLIHVKVWAVTEGASKKARRAADEARVQRATR